MSSNDDKKLRSRIAIPPGMAVVPDLCGIYCLEWLTRLAGPVNTELVVRGKRPKSVPKKHLQDGLRKKLGYRKRGELIQVRSRSATSTATLPTRSSSV